MLQIAKPLLSLTSTRVRNHNLIGQLDQENFTNNRLFNLHNGNNLAGYGYFPSVFLQALFNKCDPNINPITGDVLPKNLARKNMETLIILLLVGIVISLVLY